MNENDKKRLFTNIRKYRALLLCTNYKELFYRLLTKYFKTVILLKRNQNTAVMCKECQKILELLKELGHVALSNEFTKMIVAREE